MCICVYNADSLPLCMYAPVSVCASVRYRIIFRGSLRQLLNNQWRFYLLFLIYKCVLPILLHNRERQTGNGVHGTLIHTVRHTNEWWLTAYLLCLLTLCAQITRCHTGQLPILCISETATVETTKQYFDGCNLSLHILGVSKCLGVNLPCYDYSMVDYEIILKLPAEANQKGRGRIQSQDKSIKWDRTVRQGS